MLEGEATDMEKLLLKGLYKSRQQTCPSGKKKAAQKRLKEEELSQVLSTSQIKLEGDP